MISAIVIAAEDFGFGPASHAVAIARALISRDPRLSIFGEAHGAAAELMSGEAAFASVRPRQAIAQAPLPTGRVHVDVGNFDGALEHVSAGRPVVFVDALYWLWITTPVDPRLFDAYFALDFPGLEVRKIDEGAVTVIDQIVSDYVIRPAYNAFDVEQTPRVMVNLGGGTSPLGCNEVYLRSITNLALDVLQTTCPKAEVLITSSQSVLDLLGDLRGRRVQKISLPQVEFIRSMRRSRLLVSLPGQSVVWESVLTQTPLVLLPASNYSQHRQADAYAAHQSLSEAPQVSWSRIPGYTSLPPGLPEMQGVKLAFALGCRFAADSAAQARARDLLSEALLSRREWTKATSRQLSFQGADQVAEAVLRLAGGGTT